MRTHSASVVARCAAVLGAAAMSMGSAGCGQKGPLVLPPHVQASAPSGAPAARPLPDPPIRP